MKATLAAFGIAVAVALGVGGCASSNSKTETQRSAGEFTDDAAITAKVKSAIASDVGARTAANVNVDTYRGVVQLSGFADSKDQMERAAKAAGKVTGVKSVKNDLRLKSS
ncbi:MAG TPA: BON domain-containing protein [Burkholderiales bacterium]|nr:BON domain-containing protein [Burkholderiales bacterium]